MTMIPNFKLANIRDSHWVEYHISMGLWDHKTACRYLLENYWSFLGQIACCRMGDNDSIGDATCDVLNEVADDIRGCSSVREVARVLSRWEDSDEDQR